MILERPAPVGVKKHVKRSGTVVEIPLYDGKELAAWRAARSVQQQEMADRMRVGQSLLSYYESGKPELQETQAIEMMDAVDFLADQRDRMTEEGLAKLEAIRAARK